MTAVARAELYREVAGAGPPVVLLHSGVCDSRMWEPQWQPFGREHRVARCDFRGFGRTPLSAGAYSHPADVVELLEELELGAAALVGSSLGGGVALQVAIARPELVSALVLIGAGVRGHEWSEFVTRAWAEEEAAVERGDTDGFVEINLRTWFDGPHRSPGDVDPEIRGRVGEMQRRVLELYNDGPKDADETALVEDPAARLGEISVPTLVITGELDVPDVHDIADRFERELPNVRRATIAGTAHFPSLERPDEVNELVLEFLREVQG